MKISGQLTRADVRRLMIQFELLEGSTLLALPFVSVATSLGIVTKPSLRGVPQYPTFFSTARQSFGVIQKAV